MSIQLTPNQLVSITSIEETQRNLGRLVRLNRKILDMTQTGLGARAGVKQSAICKFEKHGDVTFELFIKTSQALDLPAWALLKIAEDPAAFEQAFVLRPNFV